jgi:GntR family transcriptional regulator
LARILDHAARKMYGQVDLKAKVAGGKRLPIYAHVANTLNGQIASGRYRVGEVLPSEHELCKSFGVSRATVRSALRTLADLGLVNAKAGIGTVVIRARQDRRDASLRGITEDLLKKGIETTSRTLSLGYETPSPALRENLRLLGDEPVLCHLRLRSLVAAPFGISQAFIPKSIGLTPDDDFSQPIIDLIEKTRRFAILYGEDVVRARMPTPKEAELLDIVDPMPVMAIRRTVYVEFDRPVAQVDWAIRSDFYDYHITLKRS